MALVEKTSSLREARVIREIAPPELKKLLDSKSPPTVLDVRQPEEFEIVRLEGSLLVPLMELPERVEEVKESVGGLDAPIVVVCRVGQRSARAVEWLEQFGFTNVLNLRGGLNGYATEVDPNLPTY